jgi:hypothetical protein
MKNSPKARFLVTMNTLFFTRKKCSPKIRALSVIQKAARRKQPHSMRKFAKAGHPDLKCRQMT